MLDTHAVARSLTAAAFSRVRTRTRAARVDSQPADVR